MTIDLEAFKTKMTDLAASLPGLGELVRSAHTTLPVATDADKSALVVSTATAAEPALVGQEAGLQAAVAGLVTSYRASGAIPPNIAQ